MIMWNKTNEKLPELKQDVIISHNGYTRIAKLVNDPIQGVVWDVYGGQDGSVKANEVEFWMDAPPNPEVLSSDEILEDIKSNTEHTFVKMNGDSFLTVDYTGRTVIIAMGNLPDGFRTAVLTLHQWEQLKEAVEKDAVKFFKQ